MPMTRRANGVAAVTDSSGTVVASYTYDAFSALTSSSESFPNGWSNPFRYDGGQGVRYDTETGLYWISVRAYDPTLGRFISHDPLGRLAAMGLDTEPYVYTYNNPVNYTDPSGLYIPGPNGERAIITSAGPRIVDGGFARTATMVIDCGNSWYGQFAFIKGGQPYIPYYDPRCVSWRNWRDNVAAVAKQVALEKLVRAKGAAEISYGAESFAADLLGLGLHIALGQWVQAGLDIITLIVGDAPMLLQGAHDLGFTGLDGLRDFLKGPGQILIGIARFVQGIASLPFAAPAIDAAFKLATGPVGAAMLILGAVIAPFISGVAHISASAVDKAQKDIDALNNTSLLTWCAQSGACGTPPNAESFEITYNISTRTIL